MVKALIGLQKVFANRWVLVFNNAWVKMSDSVANIIRIAQITRVNKPRIVIKRLADKGGRHVNMPILKLRSISSLLAQFEDVWSLKRRHNAFTPCSSTTDEMSRTNLLLAEFMCAIGYWRRTKMVRSLPHSSKASVVEDRTSAQWIDVYGKKSL